MIGLSVGIVALLFSQPPEPTFCVTAEDCRIREACLTGACESLSTPKVRTLFPIAVDELFDQSQQSRSTKIVQTIHQQLRTQLEWTGFFTLLETRALPPQRALEHLGHANIDYQAWHQSGAYAVIKGEVHRDDTALTLVLRLYLPEEGRWVALSHDRQRLPRAAPRALKQATALWVDALVEYFTGAKSVTSRRLAFAKRMKRGGPKEIGVMDTDGAFERPFTTNGSINVLPAWTADGRLSYTSFIRNNPDLYIGKTRFSSRPRMNTGAAFRADGRQVAITLSRDGNPEIYLLHAKTGKEIQRVTQHPAIDTSPSWSPDGRSLAFVTDRYTGRPQIARYTFETKEVSRLPQVGSYNTGPDWSPVGPTIVYSAMTGGERYQIYEIHTDSGIVRRLTDAGSNEEPCYSADGRHIAFTSDREGKQAIWVMNADGGNPRRVSQGKGEYFTPAWER